MLGLDHSNIRAGNPNLQIPSNNSVISLCDSLHLPMQFTLFRPKHFIWKRGRIILCKDINWMSKVYTRAYTPFQRKSINILQNQGNSFLVCIWLASNSHVSIFNQNNFLYPVTRKIRQFIQVNMLPKWDFLTFLQVFSVCHEQHAELDLTHHHC